MRPVLCVFLLMLLPLHSFAVQGGWLSPGDAFNLAHEVEHLEGRSHHHHDDNGSVQVHYDESDESVQHCLDQCASQQPITLPSAVTPQLTLTLFSVVRSELTQCIPDPIPERPQRPPQSLG